LEQVSFAQAMLPEVRSGRFDVIHTQDVVLARILERTRRAGKIRTPVILAHGTDEEPSTLGGSTYLQHLSPHHERNAREMLGDTVRHFCIPNFVDTGLFRPAPVSRLRQKLGIAPDAFVIGCAGALKKGHKRIDTLIREARDLAGRQASETAKQGSSAAYVAGNSGPSSFFLLLAGAGTEETADLERLAQSQLRDGCTIMKDLPFEEMPDFYRALDLYVHPAAEEFFGICLLEAMACGVPVLAHDSATLRWIVGWGAESGEPGGGWCVDVTRGGLLVDAWAQIRKEYEQKAAAARAHVERNFSWTAVYPRFMEMYSAVAPRLSRLNEATPKLRSCVHT